MTVYRIWIPSKQKYFKFKEINVEQYRNVLKCIDDDFDFEYSINELLKSNCTEDKFSLSSLTIIDRFVAILQLKIHSCGSQLNLTRICDKCQTKTNFSINLNDLIDKLATKVDRSFEKEYNTAPFIINCDVPCIKEDDLNLDKNNIHNRVDLYMYSFIKRLTINDNHVNLDDFSYEDRIQVCNNIPFSIINYIKNDYIDSIHSMFSDLLIKDAVCSSDDCKDVLSIKFDITSLTDAIKLLFRDSSNTSILSQYASLGMNCHFDFEFYKNICPAELNIIDNMVKNSLKTVEQEQTTNNDINLFEEYPLNNEGTVEYPSEFK